LRYVLRAQAEENAQDEIKRRVDEAAAILEIEHLLDRKPRLFPAVRDSVSR
jgi:ABC-type sugar transport system ATPase subunit